MYRSLRIPVSILALMITAALAVPAAAADDGEPRVEPAKLVVRVYYRTPTGIEPLTDVEVFLLVGGTPYYACTNHNGKAVFPDLGFGGDWVKALATGPSVNDPRCGNTLFLNPDDGTPMLVSFYKGHQGVDITDSFQLVSGRQSRKLVVKTPNSARRVCAGFKVTHQGSPGNDVLIGSPANDVINGRGGNDTIDGLGGDDIICGGSGADTISGGPGNDFLWGGLRGDTIDGGADTDWVDGGPGTDACANWEAGFSCET